MSLHAGTRLGAYEILDRIGAGGMGEVYRARETKLTSLSGSQGAVSGPQPAAREASAWSPDGRWLSGNWVSNAGLIAGVGVLELATGRASRVSEDRNIWTAPFLPDSRRLVYFTSEGQLVVVDVPEGRRRAAPESIAVAPDGRTLYFGAQKIESNVWKVEQAPREPTAR